MLANSQLRTDLERWIYLKQQWNSPTLNEIARRHKIKRSAVSTMLMKLINE